MQPIKNAHKVDSGCGHHMLDMGFRQSPVARSPRTESPRDLGHCPLNASADRTLVLNIRDLLELKGQLLRFSMGLRRQGRESSPFFLSLCAQSHNRTD